MIMVVIIIGAAVFLAVLTVVIFLIYKRPKPPVEIDADRRKIDALLAYVENQKKEAEAKLHLNNLKKAEQKEKLEHFKQTRDELKDSLRAKFDARGWVPVDKILSSADKGSIGIYVLYNETKNKYYVGQAKAISARIRKHFEVEPIARDFLSGDRILVKTLAAGELNDYRIDHIEKIGIELFAGDTDGYNKTAGNM
jgi:hypothetical protein